jgi:GNAT superfamily N-acetyltransferase
VVQKAATAVDRTKVEARLATSADRDAVLALYRELRPDDPVLEPEHAVALWMGLLAEPRIDLIIASWEGRTGATCMLASIPNLASGGRPIGIVEHVITGSAFRRRGLARAALELALECAWRRDCCKVMLLSGAQRPEAHALYRSLGFDGDIERGFVIKPPRG